MLALNSKGRVIVDTNEYPERFSYVPKAMVRVLAMAMTFDGACTNEKDRDILITYLQHLEAILPENLELTLPKYLDEVKATISDLSSPKQKESKTHDK